MRLNILVWTLVLVSLAQTAAAAGVIRGTVWVNRKTAALAQPRPADAAVPASNDRPGSPDPIFVNAKIANAQRGIGESVLWLERIPENVDRKLAGGGGWLFFRRAPRRPVPRMVQKDLAFIPRVMAVAAGSRVEFMNLDDVYHNVFSVSAAKRFDLGKYPPGRRDTVKFDMPGVINLHCDIHPDQLGYIVVAPNHAYARPDTLGNFTLPKLPPGRYTVHAWHPRLGETKGTVEMPARGNVALDLIF